MREEEEADTQVCKRTEQLGGNTEKSQHGDMFVKYPIRYFIKQLHVDLGFKKVVYEERHRIELSRTLICRNRRWGGGVDNLMNRRRKYIHKA